MHPQETRAKLRRCYVYERLPLAAAAEQAGVTYGTARRWKKAAQDTGDDWDRARSAARMAEGGVGDLTHRVIEDFALLFESTIQSLKARDDPNPIATAEALSRLADAYNKTMRAAGQADPKIAELSVALKVLEELTAYIRERWPQHLPVFAQILEPFGQRLSEVFG